MRDPVSGRHIASGELRPQDILQRALTEHRRFYGAFTAVSDMRKFTVGKDVSEGQRGQIDLGQACTQLVDAFEDVELKDELRRIRSKHEY